jgi:hypothetical protein
MSLVFVAGVPAVADAYLHLTFTANGNVRRLKWDAPVRWFATDRGAPNVSASQFQRAVEQAFATWQAVPTASIDFSFAGFTSAEPFEDDGVTVLGFQNHPDQDRVLGATTFLVDTETGEILESDIFFNSAFAWSTAAAGEAGRFDLQSVATHEIGHLAGLAHSALGETEILPNGRRRVLGTAAVMFPIAFSAGSIADRELQPDDVAGVSDLYPDGGFRSDTGAARGRVLLGGNGVIGAHVVAFNPRTGESISGFALNREGEFEIVGLTPGFHVIRVEPLDDAEPESFFGRGALDVNFQVVFHSRLFVAPAGGVGERFDVTVRPK